MVAALALGLEDSDTLPSLDEFKLSVEEIHRELKAQAKRSYLSQLLHHARDRETMIAMSERVRDAFDFLMVNMRLQSEVLSEAASTRNEKAGLANALASIVVDVAKSDILRRAAPSDVVSVSAARLPPQPRLYFGRQAETEAVAAAVTADESGRVTILGGPGMGKTTLSVAVLHHPSVAARFGTRRFFVPCGAAEGHSRFITVLTAAFGIVAAEPSAAQQQLQALLGADPSLLVIDNFGSAWETAEQRLDAEQLL